MIELYSYDDIPTQYLYIEYPDSNSHISPYWRLAPVVFNFVTSLLSHAILFGA